MEIDKIKCFIGLSSKIVSYLKSRFTVGLCDILPLHRRWVSYNTVQNLGVSKKKEI